MSEIPLSMTTLDAFRFMKLGIAGADVAILAARSDMADRYQYVRAVSGLYGERAMNADNGSVVRYIALNHQVPALAATITEASSTALDAAGSSGESMHEELFLATSQASYESANAVIGPQSEEQMVGIVEQSHRQHEQLRAAKDLAELSDKLAVLIHDIYHRLSLLELSDHAVIKFALAPVTVIQDQLSPLGSQSVEQLSLYVSEHRRPSNADNESRSREP